MPAPSESGRGRPAEMAPRHPNSPPSTREVRMLTALEDKAATEHAPRSPDRDVGSDDDESLYSVDSHGARIGPYTPERGAPPSYEHVMLSPIPTEPPSTPPRRPRTCAAARCTSAAPARTLRSFARPRTRPTPRRTRPADTPRRSRVAPSPPGRTRPLSRVVGPSRRRRRARDRRRACASRRRRGTSARARRRPRGGLASRRRAASPTASTSDAIGATRCERCSSALCFL